MTDKILFDPQRLVFIGPFSKDVVVQLRIVNQSDSFILFKMKSTRPERFKIRPVFGYIDPRGGSVTVRIICRPFDESQGVPIKDRLSAVLSAMPFVMDRPSQHWKRMGVAELKACRRVVVPVTYVKMLKRGEEAPSSDVAIEPPMSETQKHRLELLAMKAELQKKIDDINRELEREKTLKVPEVHPLIPIRRKTPLRNKPYEDEEIVEPKGRLEAELHATEEEPTRPRRKQLDKAQLYEDQPYEEAEPKVDKRRTPVRERAVDDQIEEQEPPMRQQKRKHEYREPTDESGQEPIPIRRSKTQLPTTKPKPMKQQRIFDEEEGLADDESGQEPVAVRRRQTRVPAKKQQPIPASEEPIEESGQEPVAVRLSQTRLSATKPQPAKQWRMPKDEEEEEEPMGENEPEIPIHRHRPTATARKVGAKKQRPAVKDEELSGDSEELE